MEFRSVGIKISRYKSLNITEGWNVVEMKETENAEKKQKKSANRKKKKSRNRLIKHPMKRIFLYSRE